MTPIPGVPAIIAHARSGALDHAWRLFHESGLDAAVNDPAALSLKGRLIKDRAAGAEPAERRRLFLEAAAAYGAAGEIGGATYPLINAASLALLAGDADQARARAQRLLSRLETTGDDPDETPYYAMATRAEALLLVGETARARATLEAAVALAPRAWGDHASTLRQFALILAELGEDAAWLEPLRPPRVLHFGGSMGLGGDPDGAIAAWLAERRIGFGYGALAAGADILIAEALVAAGAQLHVVLPCPVEAFRAASVAPYGGDWEARFEALLERCDSRHVAGSGCPSGGSPIEPASLQLAAEAAMGRAVMLAAILATDALQLLVTGERLPQVGEPGGSAWMGRYWRENGRPGDALVLRDKDAGPTGDGPATPCRLTAVVWLEPADGQLDREWVGRLAAAAVGANGRWTQQGLLLRFDDTAAAAARILTALAELGEAVRVGAAYDLAEIVDDPLGGAALTLGPAADLAARAAGSAPPGAAHVTGDFAAALMAGPVAVRPRVELVGEMTDTGIEDPVQLYALRSPPLK